MKVSGLDVHKDSIFCGIYNGKKQSEVKEFTTLTTDIKAMGLYLKAEGVKKIAMESTGMYWIPIWNILENMGFELMLVNPYLIKQMPGRKSDVKDAQWIAQLLHKKLLRGSLIPNEIIRELRTYSRRYTKLKQRQTNLLQTMERNLEMCSIRISSYVSNISSKSLMKVILQIVEGETSPDILIKNIHGRIRKKHGTEIIKNSLTGFVTDHHRFILEQLLEEFNMIDSQVNKTLEKMKQICENYYAKELDLLQTIPGISELSAMIIIAESGADMSAFENSGKFSGWTGLRPRNDESAGKYKSTATTKGNKYLRTILVQVAWAASRTKGSYFKEKYNRLAMRKSRKKALIAIARKIGVIIWNVLQKLEVYNPSKLPVYDPIKLEAKMNYHQREFERLEELYTR
ncbi:MAG: IS110 family transposase [Bacteroidetes bacterium]|nr:IS110 family transposase [Bacteroidota bacterium]